MKKGKKRANAREWTGMRGAVGEKKEEQARRELRWVVIDNMQRGTRGAISVIGVIGE